MKSFVVAACVAAAVSGGLLMIAPTLLEYAQRDRRVPRWIRHITLPPYITEFGIVLLVAAAVIAVMYTMR
jgi:hypothetical protein